MESRSHIDPRTTPDMERLQARCSRKTMPAADPQTAMEPWSSAQEGGTQVTKKAQGGCSTLGGLG